MSQPSVFLAGLDEVEPTLMSMSEMRKSVLLAMRLNHCCALVSGLHIGV